MMDLHTHLDLYPNALALADRVNSGNGFTLSVTTSPRAWAATSRVFAAKSNIRVGLGLHPEIVAQKYNELDMLLDYVKATRFIGEVGLDGGPQSRPSYKLQMRVFDELLKECARNGGRIISVHSRRAEADVLSLLQEHPSAGRVVLHWFSGGRADLERAVGLGCYFSVNRLMVTSQRGRNLIELIPNDKLLPESDGPFACWQGSPLMPFPTQDVASEISTIWNVPVDEVKIQFKDTLSNLLA